LSNKKNNFLAFSLLFIQPIFMASNLIVARGGVEYVPPISLAFWRWTVVVLLFLPFTYSLLIKNSKIIKKEFKKLFFLGAMGCGVCGAFPFLAGETTTVTNMGIIYTSSPIFIIMISAIFFNEKINFTKIIGLVSCLIGVFAIIIKGDLNLLLNLNFTIGDCGCWQLQLVGLLFYLSFLLEVSIAYFSKIYSSIIFWSN
jgi:drug/metabolite transporter (DMT)-like permease